MLELHSAGGWQRDATHGEAGRSSGASGQSRPRSRDTRTVTERLDDAALRVIRLAQEEAAGLNHNYVGTEHLLLGLIREQQSVAARGLVRRGVSLTAVRAWVEETIGRGEEAPSGSPPFTPRARRVLERTLRRAMRLGIQRARPEHLLLGLLREGEGVAVQVLVELGADLDGIFDEMTKYAARGTRGSGSGPTGEEPVTDVVHGVQDTLRQVSGALERIVRRLGGRG
jgi:ATP-dependent Clp protease ATP-binding subunit ClpC